MTSARRARQSSASTELPSAVSLAAACSSTSSCVHWPRRPTDAQSYAQAHGITLDAFEKSPISLDQLKACLAEQGTELKIGDVLLVRTGFIRAYEDASDDVRKELGARKGWRGVGVVAERGAGEK